MSLPSTDIPPAPHEPRSTPLPRPSLLQAVWAELSLLPYRLIARLILIGCAFLVIGWLLWSGWTSLMPFLVGFVLAYLLIPLINRLEHHMPRWVAIIIVYLGALFLLTLVLLFIIPVLIGQLEQFVMVLQSIPTWDWSGLEIQTNEFIRFYRDYTPVGIQQEVDRSITDTFMALQANAIAYLTGVLSFLLTSVFQVFNTVLALLGFIIIPVWLFYVLMDSDKGIQTLDQMLPAAIRADFWAITHIVDRVFQSYIRGQFLLGIIIASLSGIGLFTLTLFGFEIRFIPLLAVVAGFAELIPMIGPTLGAIPAVIVAWHDSPSTAVAVAILYLIIQLIESNVLFPNIVGESVEFHPAVVWILFILAASLFGFVGLLLYAPVSGSVRDIFLYLHGRLSNPPRPTGVFPWDESVTDPPP